MAERKLTLTKKDPGARKPKQAGGPEGGNLLVRARVDARKPIRINPDFVKPDIAVKEYNAHQEEFRCACCGATYKTQRGNFLNGCGSIFWRGNNGYLPVCKTCVNIWFNMLTDFYSGNEEHALRHICCMFGWYYNDQASAMAGGQARIDYPKVCLYPGKAVTKQVALRGDDFLQTVRDMCADGSINSDMLGVPVEDSSSNDGMSRDESVDYPHTATDPAAVRRWGPGFSASQYAYLEEEYQDWCDKTEVKTKSQEELVRAICFAQLNIRIQQSTGGKVDAAMKTLTDLMTNCNLTPRQHSELANLSDEKLAYGQMIRKIENEMPIPEPKDEFKDPDGIRKYINTFFFGHLAKALGIKNDAEAEYEAEMEKYAVRVSEEDSVVSADELLGDISQSETGG